MSYDLFTRDTNGQYHVASADLILATARVVADDLVKRDVTFSSPSVSSRFFIAKLAGLEHEVFAVAFLNTQHTLISYEEMFRGTIDACNVYTREIAKRALQLNASAILISHVHPSGSMDPSNADRAITKRITEALSLIDVRVLDHIIVAGGGYTSFAEKGLL